jgi:hypothetical protein
LISLPVPTCLNQRIARDALRPHSPGWGTSRTLVHEVPPTDPAHPCAIRYVCEIPLPTLCLRFIRQVSPLCSHPSFPSRSLLIVPCRLCRNGFTTTSQVSSDYAFSFTFLSRRLTFGHRLRPSVAGPRHKTLQQARNSVCNHRGSQFDPCYSHRQPCAAHRSHRFGVLRLGRRFFDIAASEDGVGTPLLQLFRRGLPPPLQLPSTIKTTLIRIPGDHRARQPALTVPSLSQT